MPGQVANTPFTKSKYCGLVDAAISHQANSSAPK